MKFDTLFNNLIFEDAEPQPAQAPTTNIEPIEAFEKERNTGSQEFKTPDPKNFQDVQGIVQPPVRTEEGQQKLQALIARMMTMSDEINGLGGKDSEPSVQQVIYDLEGGVYNEISDSVSEYITKAAGNILNAVNELRTFYISTNKRAADMSRK